LKNKKLTTTLAIASIISTTLGIIAAINKANNKLATSKGLLENKNKQIYHWRFGNISYSITGEGKPILLIHNLKEDSSSVEWSEIIPKLSRTNTVYTIDLLGCGLSERPNITYTSYMYTELINEFIRNVIKRKTAIVATGKSASFVLGACSINEENFSDLILINPESIKNLQKSPSKRTKTAEFFIKMPIIGTLIYQMHTARNMIEETFEEKYYYDPENISEALIDYYYESSHLGDGKEKNLYASLTGRYTNANIIGTLKNINNSIHILAGGEISGIQTDMKEYQYYNPSIEVEYINYTKGLPQLEAPEEVLKYINLYLYNDQ
jgi:pimeloyl-ACP methyl ester carboxylesterase